MINPNLYQPSYARVRGSNYGVKEYRPCFSMHGQAFYAKRTFKRANEAISYARRLKNRWIRLYNAAIVAEVKQVGEVLKVAA